MRSNITLDEKPGFLKHYFDQAIDNNIKPIQEK